MPDNIISTEEFFNLEQGTENIDQENIFSIEELSATGDWLQPMEVEPPEIDMPSHISLDNLVRTKGGEKPTWKDELFHSEENVYENLKEFYEDQEGVSFKHVAAG